MKRLCFIAVLLLWYATSFSQTTIIAQSTAWKYLDNGSNQGNTWRETGFNDTSWPSGNAELGYGDGGEATLLSTTVKPITTYFRKSFSVSNPGVYSSFTLKLLCDDGAVVYLNCVEVARSNLPTGIISPTTLASSEITGTAESAYASYTINPSLFIAGTNVLAVELHQATANNIDSSFNLKLEANTGLCGTAIGLNASSVTTTTATLNWASVSGILNYSIQYRPIGTSTWTTVTATTNNKTISGLAHSTTYEFQVKAACLLGGTYSAPATFSTVVPTCSTPTNLNVSSITTSGASLTWTAVSGATSYNIQYKKTGTTTWTTTTATTASKSLTGLTAGTAYEVQVQAVCLINSSYSTMVNFTTVALTCGTPAGLTASAITQTTATVSWSAISGATSYNIQGRAVGTTTWTNLNSNTNSLAVTGLTANTAYEFEVQAVCAITSAYSTIATFSTLAYSCGTPTTLIASSITGTSATVSWTAVAGATNYNVQYRIVGTNTWTTTTSTTTNKVLTGLAHSSAYEFQVQAVCVITSAYSTPSTFNTLVLSCGTPSGLAVSSPSLSGATLSWAAVSGATSYNIQYRKTGTTTWTTTTSTTTSKTLGALSSGTIYEFQVQGVCAITSAYSVPLSFSTLSLSCGTPSGLSVTAITTTTATLSWTMMAGSGSYNIQYRKTGTATWTSTTSTVNSKTISGLTPATTYQFQVQGNCYLTGSYSAAVNFSTLAICEVPSGLVATAINSSSVNIAWNAVSGATAYNIQYRPSGTTTWFTASASTNSKNLTNLSGATTYEFQVQTVCSYNSSFSTSANFTTLPDCGTPTILTANTITWNSATLSWNTVSGASSYHLRYRPIGTTDWVSASTANSSWALSNLSPSTSYEFQVQAVCAAIGLYSTSANFTTLAMPTCDIPTGLQSESLTDTSASLVWQAVSGATGYNIQYRPNGTTDWFSTSAATTNVNINNLLSGTNYEVQVQALCVINSAFSASFHFRTLLPTPTCEIVSGLAASNPTAINATLSWQELQGASGYNIQYRKIGTELWNSATSTTNNVTLSGLAESSTYEFQVQGICSVPNNFSPSATFTTLTSGTSFIFPAGSPWKYLDNGTNQGTAWSANAFDDSSWAAANGEFGYGDGDETTLVNYGTDSLNKYITTYFRKSFTITNLSAYSAISFDLIRDDGAVVYLNGAEIYRNNMPAGAIAYNTLATTAASGADESLWYAVPIDPALLVNGTNVIAVEIHQQYYDSSDLSFNGRLSVTIPGFCATPASITAANVGSSTATLNWQAISGAGSYNIQYHIVGTDNWTNTTAASNTKSLTGLTPSSNYEFKVQAVCGASGNYSATGFFTTAVLTCNAPVNIVISSVTTTTATITWQADTDAISYNIQYRPQGTATWLNAATNIASVQLANLTLSTSYEFQIQTVCSFPSAWSPISYFATPAFSCNAPTGLAISSIVSSTVTLDWQPADGATGYVVEYQLAGTNAWAILTTASTTKTINGLIASTAYEFRVKSVCSSASGNYTPVLSFTTYPAGAHYFVAPSSTWKYLDTGVNQNTAWKEINFNDSAWKTGTAEFGYGDGDEITVVNYGPEAANKYPTTYFRKTFTVNNPSEYSALSLGIVRDDGAVVYLNGTEVYRTNLPTGAIAYNTFAIESLGGSDETNWNMVAIDPALLIAGENVLAVEIHQNSWASSDLSFNGKLTATSKVIDPVVTRGAYLQKLSSDSVTIRWRTDIPSNTVVNYGTSIAYGNTVSDNTLVTEHIITLPALTPNTKYFYSIGTSTLTLQGDLKNNFITSPTIGTASPVRIWAIGDFGNGTTQQLNVRNAYKAYTGNTPTNLWLWLGDNAYTTGSDSEFQDRVFNQYTDQLKSMAVFPTPGNHDYNESGYQQPSTLSTNYPYFSIFSMPENGECGGVPSGSPKYYSFNYANIHFISIDSYGTLNLPGSPMYTWLTNDLAANTQRWTVVFMHYPPYTYGTHNSDTETTLIDMRKVITPLLESYHVDLVLAGHSHVNERSYMIKGHYDVASTFTEAMKVSTQTYNFVKSPPYDGTVYAVCGTSGQNPEVVNQPGFPMPAMYFNNNTNNCSLVIDVNGDVLSCKYLTSTGIIADDFTITKTNIVAREGITSLNQDKNALNAVLNQNTITLDYTLTENAEISAELINVLGEKVMDIQTPASQTKGAYNYEVPTRGQVAEGLYFIRMMVNGKPIVKKVYVVK